MSSTSNSSSSYSRWARTKTKTILECNGQNLVRSVEKSWKNRTIWSQQSSPKNKRMPHFDHFPRPGEIGPYVHMCIAILYCQQWHWKTQGTVCSFTVPFKVGVHMDDGEAIGELPHSNQFWMCVWMSCFWPIWWLCSSFSSSSSFCWPRLLSWNTFEE